MHRIGPGLCRLSLVWSGLLTKHIFIVRIWREYRDLEHTDSILRGVIQHVPSGKKYPLTDFNSILAFILSYLQEASGELAFGFPSNSCLDRPALPGAEQEAM